MRLRLEARIVGAGERACEGEGVCVWESDAVAACDGLRDTVAACAGVGICEAVSEGVAVGLPGPACEPVPVEVLDDAWEGDPVGVVVDERVAVTLGVATCDGVRERVDVCEGV